MFTHTNVIKAEVDFSPPTAKIQLIHLDLNKMHWAKPSDFFAAPMNPETMTHALPAPTNVQVATMLPDCQKHYCLHKLSENLIFICSNLNRQYEPQSHIHFYSLYIKVYE